MPIVILESPYSGDIERNVKYGQRAMLDARGRGETVIMPHLLWTQHPDCKTHFISDDDKLHTAATGRQAALKQIEELRRIPGAKVVFYMDYGVSHGMSPAFKQCRREGIAWEERRIGKNK